MRLAYGDPIVESKARCPECLHVPALREAWGCDAPAPEPVFARTCPRCSGFEPECEVCSGSGTELVYRCAASQVTPDVVALLSAYYDYEKGVLPSPGPMQEQAVQFVDGVRLIEAERAAIEREREEARKRKEKAAR